jgi:predicted esterase
MAEAPSRLRARPGAGGNARARSGTHELPDDALLRVPGAAARGEPCPLLVLFHGAGSTPEAALPLAEAMRDDAGVIVLLPQSAGRTWDVIERGFGLDARRLDRALAAVFESCPVDPARIALGGFSDGASYALSLGLDNGELAGHLVAFSPGFSVPADPRGRPRIFVAHGVHDRVLPIERCSRRLVPRLRAAGYDVTYEEFDGGHEVPPALAHRALEWLEHG